MKTIKAFKVDEDVIEIVCDGAEVDEPTGTKLANEFIECMNIAYTKGFTLAAVTTAVGTTIGYVVYEHWFSAKVDKLLDKALEKWESRKKKK